ncbi:response regulator transcription factor [Fuerstiella marisgermanici]|uniref:Response regulator receiver domain protein n=1 Tax=Fuerstiella marisgermanici TaxID=1891926 RepID=A0A1P8WEN8_9PLAN|nr:response regulator transcription factor [Fuerstiella marisgermanici]APZ92511.1 Response regulator receiver domain protein [Fuerstiella marisgermanici]
MAARTVVSIGQCRPDTAAITHFLKSNFDVEVVSTDLPEDSLAAIRSMDVHLVLINRKLDADYSDGLEILKTLKEDSELADIPVMLVSNFSDWQQIAVDAGATYGFGKAELQSPDTIERVRGVLGLA